MGGGVGEGVVRGLAVQGPGVVVGWVVAPAEVLVVVAPAVAPAAVLVVVAPDVVRVVAPAVAVVVAPVVVVAPAAGAGVAATATVAAAVVPSPSPVEVASRVLGIAPPPVWLSIEEHPRYRKIVEAVLL